MSEGVCAGARLREGVRRKSEREQRQRRKKGAVRGASVSLFSSRPVLLLIRYLFCPSLFLFPLLVLEGSRLSVSQCLCERISVCVCVRDNERERRLSIGLSTCPKKTSARGLLIKSICLALVFSRTNTLTKLPGRYQKSHLLMRIIAMSFRQNKHEMDTKATQFT